MNYAFVVSFSILFFLTAVAQASGPAASGAITTAIATSNAQNSDTLATGENPPPIPLIESKARTLAGAPSGSGTVYGFTTDRDLIGKSKADALKSLSGPTISLEEHARKVYEVILLNASWKFVNTNGKAVNNRENDSDENTPDGLIFY